MNTHRLKPCGTLAVKPAAPRSHRVGLKQRQVLIFSAGVSLQGGGAAAVTSSENRYPRIGLLGAAAARVTFDPSERVARSLTRPPKGSAA